MSRQGFYQESKPAIGFYLEKNSGYTVLGGLRHTRRTFSPEIQQSMNSTKEKLIKEVAALFREGADIYRAESAKQNPVKKKATVTKPKQRAIEYSYQVWYTKALPVVKQVLPDRYQEFVDQYQASQKRKEIDFLTYTIGDYLIGLRVTMRYAKEEVVNPFNAFSRKFQIQLFILRSCLDRLNSALDDIRGALQAELFDDEVSAAEELHKKGHVRAAGAVAGVTLERHFLTVAQRRGIKVNKKNPAIFDYNDIFKKEGVYDVPDWWFIQRLGDLRNLSVHFKDREPTKDEIDELIKGVQKVVKTIF